MYAGANVVVGPSAMSWHRLHPPPPRHMSLLCSVEEGGEGELSCLGAMYVPAYLSIRGGNGNADRHRLLSRCLCAALGVK